MANRVRRNLRYVDLYVLDPLNEGIMIRIKAKIKIRYTIIFCVALSFATYVIIRFGICCDNLLHKSLPKSSNILPRPDVIRRSFTAKWHDSRELLNDVSETQKMAKVREKYLRRQQQSTLDEQFEKVRAEEEKLEWNKIVANAREITENSDVKNPEELEKNSTEEEEEGEEATTAAYAVTQPEDLEDDREARMETTLDDEQQPKWEMAAQQQTLRLKGKSKQDNLLKDSLMDLNHNDKGAKSERLTDRNKPQNLTKHFRINTAPEIHKNPRLPTLENVKKELADKRGNEIHTPVEDHSQNSANDKSHLQQAETENHNDEGTEEEKRVDEEEEGNDDGNYEDMKRSNKTIFDPHDGVITYHALHDKEFFTRSQINKSRVADMQWASEFPMTPEEVMRRFRDQLPHWEQYEIFHYPKIWYLGLGANKTQIQSNDTNNFGFDYDADTNKEGHYRVVVGDHIGYRYEILKFLGSGTFGSVVLARDWSNPIAMNVALKIMHYDENEKYIIREIKMMKFIEKNAANRDYFSRMVATFQFRNHKCLVLELLGKSVHRHNVERVRNTTLFRRFATDILNGMNYLAQLHIVHGDLKPDNIMFIYGKNNESEGQLLKVADFGIGCISGSKDFQCPAYYMQTRYYRAPEVILSLSITPQVDMFSVGVIFAEFFLGFPPFYGESEVDQLAAIMEVLGLPPTKMIAKSPRKKIYAKAICYETENGFHRKPYRKPLTKVLKGMDPALFDLIARCLEFDPEMRITAEEALRHPFITGTLPAIGLPPPLAVQRLLGDA